MKSQTMPKNSVTLLQRNLRSLRKSRVSLQRSSNSEKLRLTKVNFYAFYLFVFSESLKKLEGRFIQGEHLRIWCQLFQRYPYLAIASARLHGKTLLVYAFIMWHLWKLEKAYFEILYLCYKGDLAEYHLDKVNMYIEANEYFKNFEKLTTARTIVDYGYKGNRLKAEPSGILSFKRGRHNDLTILDDVYRDPNVKGSGDNVVIDPAQVIKVTSVLKKEVIHLPKKDTGGLLGTGTRISEHDFFQYAKNSNRFYSDQFPAIKSFKDKLTLWPEMFSFDELMQIKKDNGEDEFNQEYMCVPMRTVGGYLNYEDLEDCVNVNLESVDYHVPRETKAEVFGGWDIGKKMHPSHISVIEWSGNEKEKKKQILSLWLDHVDYGEQLEIVRKIIDNLKVDRLQYDATRGEFAMAEENGLMPAECEPRNFSVKTKNSGAQALGTMIRKREIEFIADDRQINQMLNCDRELKSETTNEGHGDSFWSNALACECFSQPKMRVIFI